MRSAFITGFVKNAADHGFSDRLIVKLFKIAMGDPGAAQMFHQLAQQPPPQLPPQMQQQGMQPGQPPGQPGMPPQQPGMPPMPQDPQQMQLIQQMLGGQQGAGAPPQGSAPQGT